MSTEQKIIMTALPNGVDAKTSRLLLSIFVSPRLRASTAETTLAPYSDFHDWPATLSKLRFRVTIAGQSFDEPARVERVAPAARSELWKALFSPSTLVRSYVYDDLSDRAVRSSPVRDIETFFKERYGRAAAERVAPTRCTPRRLPRVEYPSAAGLFDPGWFGAITPQSLESAKAGVEQRLQANKAITPGLSSGPADAFAQHLCFHQGAHYTDKEQKDGQPPNAAPPEVPVFDFHEMVSSLGDYPHVLRLLGLVVDLSVAADGVAPSGRVQLGLIDAAALAAPPVTPLTRYAFDAARGRFAAAPNEAQTELRDGMLRLDDEALYGLVQVDVDGAGIKLVNHVGQSEQAANNPSFGTQQKSALPSLRSAGISLVRTGRASDFVQAFGTSKQKNEQLAQPGQPDLTFGAEELVRGYRVDVREVTGDPAPAPWRSLCWRKGTYRFLNDPKVQDVGHVDEGIIDAAVTEATCGAAAGEPPDLKLTESLFRWAGWSLAVPKPACPGDPLSQADSTAENSFNFRAGFDLATDEGKLLPRLRFGRRYQLRVRAVDLAGNSLVPGDPAEITTKGAVTYGRFEPVGWPSVLLREPVVLKSHDAKNKIVQTPIAGKEGESVDRLVVRSDYETAAVKANAATERHVVPASANPEVAETHGMFDKPDGTGLDKKCFQTIAGKGGALAEVEPGKQLALPYLPDPLARGVTFLGLPGREAAQVSFRPDDSEWPELKPFRLRVEAVKDASEVKPPDFSAPHGERLLTVYLPPAEIARVRLSTYLAEIAPQDFDDPKKVSKSGRAVLDQLGLWQWAEEWVTKQGASPKEIEDWLHLVRLVMLTGQHWIVTPYHEIVLVHAVGRPLKEPQLALTAQKDAAASAKAVTFARLGGQIVCDGKSTGKLDVLADWEEPRDDPDEPQPRAPAKPAPAGMADPVEGHAHVIELPISLPEIGFNEEVSNQLDLRHGTKKIGTFNLADGVVTLTDPDLRHEFGDTRTRLVNYSAVATTRFREYFPPSKPETDAQKQAERALHARTSLKQPVRVLSSARPDAPKVLYVIPAFRWTKGDGASVRHGGGLRVYLERGWYSSGDGELLGAVLMPGVTASSQPAALDETHPLKPYVSQWGADPLRASAGTNGLLAPDHFTNALASNPAGGGFQTTELTLDELPGGPAVSVAPHAVGYDEVRRLWYCDIEINPGDSYFPFVRLALARYQPNSLAGVHLSRVALADFIQLAPGRAVSVTPAAGAPSVRNVTVTGKTYRQSRSGLGKDGTDLTEGGGTTVRVTVESRDAPSKFVARDAGGELDWGAGETVTLARSADGQSWAGPVTLPANPGAKQLRLVIRETEALIDSSGNVRLERLVYADVVRLN
jgi:hypothetical protein